MKMKKRRHRNLLALFLAATLTLASLPGTVMAEEIADDAENTVSTESAVGTENTVSTESTSGTENTSDTESFTACAKTEGCTLQDGHEGECITPEAEKKVVKEKRTVSTRTDAPVTDEASLQAAIEAGGDVTLAGNIELTGDVTVVGDVVLDLNGFVLTTGGYSIKVGGGDLTIRDSSAGQTGKITGTDYIVDMNLSGGNTVTLESGTLEGTGWTAVIRVASGDSFYMSGGIVRQTQSNATYVVMVNAGGTANVTGGRIEGGIRGISLAAATSKLTVGNMPAGDSQTKEEASAVYVSSVYAGNAAAAVVLNSGTVGKVFGNVGTDFVLNCWFEQDVSSSLPGSLVAEQIDGHWIVRALTEEDAVAKIGDTLYGSLVKAAFELKDGETLTLLRDYEGSQSVAVSADNAVIDLNGYSITNTAEGGYGINFSSTYRTSGAGGSVSVINSGSGPSKITAATPLRVHSGNSQNLLPLTLGDNIELESAGDTYIELGTSACIEYSDAAASYVKTGGFLSTSEDGGQYIYGSFVAAAENDVNKTAVLLNDYQGGIALSSSQELTLDLNGHTVTSGSTSVIRVNTSDASLTIKNGTMITENGTGAEVGLPDGGGIGGVVYHNNVTLNLENVDLTANGSAEDDYGIVCNGTSTGINISLKGGSVNVPNAIGIYFPPADSTLTIDGTEITGTTGVAIKGGDVTIKGGAKISGTGEKNDPAGVNSGVTNTGDAVYVEGNYDRDITVNIESGTFTSANSTAVQMLKDESTTSDTEEIVISGGTFSHKPEEEFIYSGLEAVNTGDGTFTIRKLADVYVNGTVGNDSNSGADRDHAVKTLEHALKLVADDGTIYICGSVTIGSSLTVEGVRIERAADYKGTLIRVENGTVLTLSDTTIDGKNVEANGALIYANSGATVNIQDGTKLINNEDTAVMIMNATLNMSGGEISGNHSLFDGGAVYAYSGTLNLTGGEIKNNSTLIAGGGICFLGAGTMTLDGTKISGNEAVRGGGVYFEGRDGDALFTMKSGEISENRLILQYDEDGYPWMGDGAGICAWYGDNSEDMTIDIQGGTISGNTASDLTGDEPDITGAGTAISLNGNNSGYTTLRLSGSPTISGDVFLWDDENQGPVIEVGEGFSPAAPVEVGASWRSEGTVAVSYPSSLTAAEAESLFVSQEEYMVLADNGNNKLAWLELVKVSFKAPDNRTIYREIYLRPGALIDSSLIPEEGEGEGHVTVPEGYEILYWHRYGETEAWDFTSDTVPENIRSMTLLASWGLKAPEVSVTADKELLHGDSETVLTAEVSHVLSDLSYTYQWYKDGTAIPGETGSQLTVSEAGSYTVKVTAQNGNDVSSEAESVPVVITAEGHTYVPAVTKPTCTERGYTTYTCSVCGDSYVADYTEPTGHSFPDKWSSDGKNHWYECVNCGEKKDVAAHTFKWVKDKDGSRHEECTVCGYEKTAAKAAQTGDDNSGLLLWLFVLAASGIAVTGIAAYRRKR